MVYNPIEISNIVESRVTYSKDGKIFRKYYRFRTTKFYGGSATGDVIGCNLYCRYCWSLDINTHLSSTRDIGLYMDPEEAALRLLDMASRSGFRYIRLSGGEPTIGFNHVLQLLEYISRLDYSRRIVFILETNGILIGYRKEYAVELSRFPFVVARVSLKGCSEDEFSAITGAGREFYEYQLKAVKHLFESNVGVAVAITVSFCRRKSLSALIERLLRVEDSIMDRIELEVVKLYPKVVKRLYKANLLPWIAIDPRRNILLRGEAVERAIGKRCRESDN